MRIGLLGLNKDGRIALFNAAAEQLTGYQAASVLGIDAGKLFAGLHDKLERRHGSSAFNGSEISLEMVARCKDGRLQREIREPWSVHIRKTQVTNHETT